MTRLVSLQLPIEIVQALLQNMEEFEAACVVTSEYLESGLCDDAGMLDMQTPEEAVWAERFSKSAREFISEQLAHQGLASVLADAAHKV